MLKLILLFALTVAPANADVLTILQVDNTASVITSSQRFWSPGGDLVGPGPGIGYAGNSCVPNPFTGCTSFVFGEPGNEFDVTDLLFLENGVSNGSNYPTTTEVIAFTNNSTLPNKCSDNPFCVSAENGIVYPVLDIHYTDGTTDSIFFEWIVTPEPTSALLFGTVVVGVLMARARKRS